MQTALGALVLLLAIVFGGPLLPTRPDYYGCWYDASADAWESASTTDGLCNDGPHAHYHSRYGG